MSLYLWWTTIQDHVSGKRQAGAAGLPISGKGCAAVLYGRRFFASVRRNKLEQRLSMPMTMVVPEGGAIFALSGKQGAGACCHSHRNLDAWGCHKMESCRTRGWSGERRKSWRGLCLAVVRVMQVWSLVPLMGRNELEQQPSGLMVRAAATSAFFLLSRILPISGGEALGLTTT